MLAAPERLSMLLLAALLACEALPDAPPPPSTPVAAPAPDVAPAPPPPTPAMQDPLADMRGNPLRITRHGECRMSCRKFDQAEVQAFLEDATWKPERTRHDGPCPSHALEGTTRDGQHARMVFAACDDVTKLVTAIDLDTDHYCSCD